MIENARTSTTIAMKTTSVENADDDNDDDVEKNETAREHDGDSENDDIESNRTLMA